MKSVKKIAREIMAFQPMPLHGQLLELGIKDLEKIEDNKIHINFKNNAPIQSLEKLKKYDYILYSYPNDGSYLDLKFETAPQADGFIKSLQKIL